MSLTIAGGIARTAQFKTVALLGVCCLTYGALAPSAAGTTGRSEYEVTTGRISAHVAVIAGRLGPVQLRDEASGHAVTLRQPFLLGMRDGTAIPASTLRITKPLSDANVAGTRLCADLSGDTTGAGLRWCLIAGRHAGYLRMQLTVAAATTDLPITEVRMLDFSDPGARLAGTVKGSPVVDRSMYFGFEHPLSWAKVDAGRVTAGITRQLPLRAGQSATYSSVAGVAAPGQLRREFLAYLQAERPRRYEPFLHYNSWFDLGFGNRYDEAGARDRIDAFAKELGKRNVQIDSFLFDDGWDNPNSLWRFDSGFPHGFSAIADAARRIRAGIGVWMSPWGGYGEQKKERIAYGRAHGYEIVRDGYALSGPRYYEAFERACAEMIDLFGVNQFKFDGTGNADRVFPGSTFDSDFDAAIHLIERLRDEKRGIFINLTAGTHPSPFWVLYADSIWRGGEDSGFAGEGTWRQRWITYRDQQVYLHIVQHAPLYPLNSLMLHGIIYAQQAKHLDDDPGNDFAEELQTYFGSGTQLQELYVTPSLLQPKDWDILAKAAKWSRQRAAILQDTHWIGGDPSKLEVYGWAAWSPEGWVITVRNPSTRPQAFPLELGTALELPPGAPRDYSTRDPFAIGPSQPISANTMTQIALQPFEVRTLEWTG
ncbi:enterotoxin [Mycobacterium alsense]|uniref:Enterotoxin n=1 Tax=Mycobacterium alsense TaxID=324058 RepID=A0ABD6NUR5_9MYCO|nr:enterotoxin [Mycobacterium alsense]OBG29095.1 enterotoxin [Mycobacterium alsense]